METKLKRLNKGEDRGDHPQTYLFFFIEDTTTLLTIFKSHCVKIIHVVITAMVSKILKWTQNSKK